jgi:hypothetical protein
MLVDLVLETLELPATLTIVGPTVAEQDVAVGKLIALFDRAKARDFVDVFKFCRRYEPVPLLELAARRDPGLGPRHLAERLRRVTEQLTAADLPTATRRASRRSGASTSPGGRPFCAEAALGARRSTGPAAGRFSSYVPKPCPNRGHASTAATRRSRVLPGQR